MHEEPGTDTNLHHQAISDELVEVLARQVPADVAPACDFCGGEFDGGVRIDLPCSTVEVAEHITLCV